MHILLRLNLNQHIFKCNFTKLQVSCFRSFNQMQMFIIHLNDTQWTANNIAGGRPLNSGFVY